MSLFKHKRRPFGATVDDDEVEVLSKAESEDGLEEFSDFSRKGSKKLKKQKTDEVIAEPLVNKDESQSTEKVEEEPKVLDVSDNEETPFSQTSTLTRSTRNSLRRNTSTSSNASVTSKKVGRKGKKAQEKKEDSDGSLDENQANKKADDVIPISLIDEEDEFTKKINEMKRKLTSSRNHLIEQNPDMDDNVISLIDEGKKRPTLNENENNHSEIDNESLKRSYSVPKVISAAERKEMLEKTTSMLSSSVSSFLANKQHAAAIEEDESDDNKISIKTRLINGNDERKWNIPISKAFTEVSNGRGDFSVSFLSFSFVSICSCKPKSLVYIKLIKVHFL
jgi:hypothetical protein